MLLMCDPSYSLGGGVVGVKFCFRPQPQPVGWVGGGLHMLLFLHAQFFTEIFSNLNTICQYTMTETENENNSANQNDVAKRSDP